MTDEGTIKWKGKSGTSYTYWIYKIGASFTSAPANYVFAKKTEQGKLSAIYIGQTGDISERFDNHEKMPCITRNKATHVCVHKSSESETERCAEEDDLIANYKPPCNETF